MICFIKAIFCNYGTIALFLLTFVITYVNGNYNLIDKQVDNSLSKNQVLKLNYCNNLLPL